MATIVVENAHEEQQFTDSFQDLSIQDQEDQAEMMEEEKEKISNGIYAAGEMTSVGCASSSSSSSSSSGSSGGAAADNHIHDDSPHHYGVCAICLNKIILQETALVKGCEHAYCVNCILRWASYKKEPTCPQCKYPFEFLNVHRSLDGSIHDYMFEESVCLLLRASWYKPLIVEEKDEVDDVMDYYYSYAYEDEEEEIDEVYFGGSSSLRIGNRRWGDNGYVRAGRQEARPVPRLNIQNSSAGPSRQPKKKETAAANESPAVVGRRAKRALKREAADKAAAEKHQQHLVRLGRK